MPRKPINDTAVDVSDGHLRLIEPITEMPGAMPQVMERGLAAFFDPRY